MLYIFFNYYLSHMDAFLCFWNIVVGLFICNGFGFVSTASFYCFLIFVFDLIVFPCLVAAMLFFSLLSFYCLHLCMDLRNTSDH